MRQQKQKAKAIDKQQKSCLKKTKKFTSRQLSQKVLIIQFQKDRRTVQKEN